MIVRGRSNETAGRPVTRPVGACLCALAVLAPLAVGSPSAFAADEPVSEAPAVAVVAPPEVQPPVAPEVEPPAAPVVEAPSEPVVEPPPPPEPPVAPEVDPPVAPDVEPPAAPEPPVAPEVEPPEAPEPDPPAPPEPPAQRADDPPPPEAGQNALAIAQNQSTVIQVVWQLQRGCETYCWSTSQTQTASQGASTTQSATAQAGGAPIPSSSSAQATNASLTLQFAWQLQVGCIAFCYGTSQSQVAAQVAQTVQTAEALAAISAWAANVAETIQQVFQFQQGCREECYGTSQYQSIAQQQSTSQSASAVSGGDPPGVSLPPFPVIGADGIPELPGWLIALALNIGATIQVSVQYDDAACRSYCRGDAQEQLAAQLAVTIQSAEAIAGAVAEPAPVEQPLPPSPPEEPPAVVAATPAAVVAANERDPGSTLVGSGTLSASGRALVLTVRRPASRRPRAGTVGVLTDFRVPTLIGAELLPAATKRGSSESRTGRSQLASVAPAADSAQPQAPVSSALLPGDRHAAEASSAGLIAGVLAGTFALLAVGVAFRRRFNTSR